MTRNTLSAIFPPGPSEVPMPFKSLGLHPLLVQATREMRYVDPHSDSSESDPGYPRRPRPHRHRAQTGTGKTAAFLLSILHQLLGRPHGSTQALIVTPTRELAQQIDDV